MVCGLSTKHKEAQAGTGGGHLLTTHSFTREYVQAQIDWAQALRKMDRRTAQERLRGTVVATLFYEPSTRTRLSFESAAVRLGASVISAENALEHSSAKKGETLKDVFRVVGRYADAIVIRHHEANSMYTAATVSPVPIINAGAGAGEHPTQALLDVYTLWREFGRVDGLKVCLVGDLKYGRTVHSLLQTLTLFQDVEVTLLSPSSLQLPEDLMSSLIQAGLSIRVGSSFDEVLPCVDAVYQTRIQKERLQHADEASGAGQYTLGVPQIRQLATHARILHPLPRVDEIHPILDDDPKAAYFRQVENGLWMRMAILDGLLGGVAQ